MRHSTFGLAGLCAVLATAPAVAREANTAPVRVAAADSVPAEPQQTSASFGDWVVRCQRAGDAGKRICEVAQSIVMKGQQQPVAQVALGKVAGSLLVTVLLPNNVSFDKAPQIGTDETHMTPLTYRRCLPGGCLADAKLDAATVKAMRTDGKPGRLVFTDASERTLALPFSFRGLAQGLDDLDKEASR